MSTRLRQDADAARRAVRAQPLPVAPGVLRTALVGGSVAAALDLAFAIGWYTPPMGTVLTVPHSIASGVLGRAAYEGGVKTAILGTFLHFSILWAAAAIYAAAAREWPLPNRRPWLAGPVSGIAIYAVMNLVVLPLSAIPFRPDHSVPATALGLLVHATLVGLPIALAARHYLGRA